MAALTEHQSGQVAIAASANIGCLSGGPGTGKTFSIAQHIKSLPGPVAVCAPTGKAAVRVSELMQRAGVPIEATTIHRLLVVERNGHDGEGWGFYHNRYNPLNESTIIVDESSMISTQLMSSLLAACETGSRILFVGDPYQLPPVGHGKPFADLIGSGVVPHGHLVEIHRFAGRIAHVCQAIRTGKPWQPSPAVNVDWSGSAPIESPENMRHIERPNARSAGSAILGVIDRVKQHGLDPIMDVQVLCATNDNGLLSRKSLNEKLQQQFNPDGRSVGDCPYRLGDKVINLKNGIYDSHWSGGNKPNDESYYISNGDVGIVIDVDRKFAGVQFDGGRCVRINKKHWKQVDLAYAVTVHKAQGSQWPVVIVVADESGAAHRVCGRSWWYTAISRASILTVTFGRRNTIDRHCRQQNIEQRKTFLAHDLKKSVSIAAGA